MIPGDPTADQSLTDRGARDHSGLEIERSRSLAQTRRIAASGDEIAAVAAIFVETTHASHLLSARCLDLPVQRLPPEGSLGTPKKLGTGATFFLGPVRLHVDNWECRAQNCRHGAKNLPCRTDFFVRVNGVLVVTAVPENGNLFQAFSQIFKGGLCLVYIK